jgi:hypothetical protein
MANNFSTDLETGSNQYWNITDAAQTGLDFTTALTFSAWVKFESLQNQVFIIKGDAATSEPYRWLYIHASTILRFQINTNTSTADVTWTPSAGVWYQVAVTYNAGTVKFYVDGAQQGTDQSVDASITPDSSNFTVGSNNGAGTSYDGLLNNILVYSTAQNDAAIAALYGAGAGGCTPSTTNLVSWWFSDNNNGDDLHGGNDLTNNNTATFSSDVPFSCGAAVGGRDGRSLSLCGVGQ